MSAKTLLARSKHKGTDAKKVATPIPTRVLIVLFIAFGGALAVKAWDERQSQDRALMAQQTREAMAVAAYLRSELVEKKAQWETALSLGQPATSSGVIAGLSNVKRAPKTQDNWATLSAKGDTAIIFAQDRNEGWWQSEVKLDDVTPSPVGERNFKIRLNALAPSGARISFDGMSQVVSACAPVNGAAMSACVTRTVPLLGVNDLNRLLIYLLLLAAPGLAVIGLINTVKSNVVRLEVEHVARNDFEERWRELELAGNGGFWSWDTQSRTIYLREQASEMLGISTSVPVALDEFLNHVSPSHRTMVQEAIEKAVKTGLLSVRFQGAGEYAERHFDMQGGDSKSGVNGILTDVTSNVRIENRSSALERLARTVVDAYPGPFAAWDKRKRLIYWNKSFARMFALGDDMLRVGASYDTVMSEAFKQVRVERPASDKSGGRELLLLSDVWLSYHDRTTVDGGLVSVGVDISSIKEQQDYVVSKEKKLSRLVLELERAQGQAQELAAKYAEQKVVAERASQSKGVFLANMSHELRTPLNAINGFSEMLVKEIFGPLGDERYNGYAKDILASGEHLLDMINDILDMSKIEAGKMSISRRLIDPIESVDAAVRMIRRKALDKDIELKLSIDETVPQIEGDHRAIKQMVLNLISNAIKFTDGGGKIAVTIRQAPEHVAVSVQDNGIGIPAKDLPRLAKPFEQSTADEGRNSQGTGLGLSLTKSFAEMHGGHMKIESKENVGTRVTFFLPISEEDKPKPSTAA